MEPLLQVSVLFVPFEGAPESFGQAYPWVVSKLLARLIYLEGAVLAEPVDAPPEYRRIGRERFVEQFHDG